MGWGICAPQKQYTGFRPDIKKMKIRKKNKICGKKLTRSTYFTLQKAKKLQAT